MSQIKPYKHCKKCGALIVSGNLCEDCKPKTNADRIRQMTDEELAEWLDLHGECNQCVYHPTQCKTECNEGHLKWLKQEVSYDANKD